MTTTIASSGIAFNYNTFLQRGANLWDLPDPASARAALGVSAAGTALSPLTFGVGLNTGTYDGTSAETIAVDSSSVGVSNKIVKYDASGFLATAGTVVFGDTSKATISRGSGANDDLAITQLGTGALIIQNVNGSGVKLQTYGTGYNLSTSDTGTIVSLPAYASGATSLTASDGGSATSKALFVDGNSLFRTGTTITADGVSVDGVITFLNGLDVATGATIAGCPTFTEGATIATGQTLALPGVSISGNPSFTGGLQVSSGQFICSSGNPTFTAPLILQQGYLGIIFKCKKSANQSLPAGTTTTITFPVNVIDQGLDYDSATGRYYVAHAGWYHIAVSLQFATALSGYFELVRYINATSSTEVIYTGTSTSQSVYYGAVKVQLAYYDYVFVRVVNVGSASTVQASTSTYLDGNQISV